MLDNLLKDICPTPKENLVTFQIRKNIFHRDKDRSKLDLGRDSQVFKIPKCQGKPHRSQTHILLKLLGNQYATNKEKDNPYK